MAIAMAHLAAELADELAARAQVRGRWRPSERREHAANVDRVLAALERLGEPRPIASTRAAAAHGRQSSPRPVPPELVARLHELRDDLDRIDSPALRASIHDAVRAAVDQYRGGRDTLALLVEAVATARARVAAVERARPHDGGTQSP